jgi:catechol 2,3-dioxygenase-like lactoylglutathione lyase family enzyme
MLGFAPAGGMIPDRPDQVAALQGLPEVDPKMAWLVDQQGFFQLELFEFRKPEVRSKPADWRPSDIGYSVVGLHVSDFDLVLESLEAAGEPLLTAPVGEPGSRRGCVRDPDGVLLELMEDDPRGPSRRERPRPELPVVTRSVRLSVPDLERSRRFFVDTLGMEPDPDGRLHGPEHEALWGLPGAVAETELLWSGDFAVELVRYTEPAGRPRPEGYRISDQGILNVALGSRSRSDWRVALDAVAAGGYTLNRELDFPFAAVNYVMDDQGFSAELFFLEEDADGIMGFLPVGQAGV